MEDLFISYPQFRAILVEKVKEYDDQLKVFFEKTLN